MMTLQYIYLVTNLSKCLESRALKIYSVYSPLTACVPLIPKDKSPAKPHVCADNPILNIH